MSSRTRITSALVGLIVLVLAGWVVQEQLTEETPPRDSGMTARALSELPADVADTWRLIERGGPFPFPQDGAVFQNREKLLPGKEPGYYREYTVPTAGDRGPRRLVRGEGGELYYTEDHYRSFVVVDPGR